MFHMPSFWPMLQKTTSEIWMQLNCSDANIVVAFSIRLWYVVLLQGGRIICETAIIERYRRRESSVEEALIEIYLAGV